jgi:hypothetical protein
MDDLDNNFLALRRGYYCPSFFKLGVETIFDLDNLNILGEAPFSTFFHEYIHFLQDITTTYGLMNCCIVVDRIKHVNHSLLENKNDKSFKVPFNYSTDSITTLNKDIQNVYLGQNPGVNRLDFIEIQFEESSVQLPDPYNKKLRKVVVYHYSSPGIVDNFDFGALCIIETMAHIAQKSISPSTDHDDVPYKSAIIVAKHIYSVIGDNMFYVFSLCDACLMLYHPADAFYTMLHLMKDRNFVPTSELDIYNFVYDNTKAETVSLQDLFSRTVGLAIGQLSDYFTTDIFENERKWVKYVLLKAQEIRLTRPDFIVQIIKKGKANTPEFAQLLDELGTPLMVNLDGKSWFNPPKELHGTEIHIDRFAAIREIFYLYELGIKKCDLQNFCKLSPEGDITDNHCDGSPWERSKQKQICAYGAFWRTWGLSDYAPNN